jgi:hypothetical protein
MIDQQILNKITIEQLRIAKEHTEHNTLKNTAEMLIEQIDMANSNVTYEQANLALKFNGNDKIRLNDILPYMNKKLWEINKCLSKNYIANRDKFRRFVKSGNYSFLDVMLETERLLSYK